MGYLPMVVFRTDMRWGVHFLSVHEHTIDAKNRLAIPAEIRAAIDTKVHGEGWVAGPGLHGLLTLWPSRTFDTMLAPFTKEPLVAPAIDQWRTMLFRNSARLEVDSAGRIRLPERLLKAFRLSSSVVILGAGDALEIMDAEAWKASQDIDTDMAATIWKQAALAWKGSSATEHSLT